jgi:transcriptional regulator with PAS, ATPase and Fis domain
MADRTILDLQHLEMLATNDPNRLMEDLAQLWEQYNDSLSHKSLTYYKSMALVTLSRFEEAEQVAGELLEWAIEQNDTAVIARTNIILSRCYNKLDMVYKEKPCLDIALDAAKKTRNGDLIAEVLCYIGNYYQVRKDRSKAMDTFVKAEKQLTENSPINIKLKILMETSSAFYMSLQYDKALIYLSRALALSSQTNDVDRQLLIINNLSTLYMMINKFDEAEQMLNKGLSMSKEHKVPIRNLMFLFSLGVFHLRQDAHVKAMEYFLESESFSTQVGFKEPRFMFDLNSNLAGCYRFLEQNDLALARLDEAAKYVELIHDPAAKAELDVNRGNFLISLGRYPESRKLLTSVVNFANKHKLYDLMTVAQKNLARSYELEGNLKQAIKLLLDLSNQQSEYHSYIQAEKSKELDLRIKALMDDYESVQEQYSALAEGYQSNLARDFVGHSKTHRKVLEAALLAAQHPSASVLITGESGTGKDVLAHIIHFNSARRNSPFVAVNMAAISSSLLESEFFGHKRGSFTGATHDTKGFFLEANKGSLFLDEISEMPTNLQAKLLRVLESRKLSPVGSSSEIAFDTRVISSTNRNVMEMINQNSFRLDLYHRLNTIEIYIPPLRERSDDIPALIDYYTEKIARDLKILPPRIDVSFVSRMQEYSFPGNVRELKNIIERLMIMQKSRLWDSDTLEMLPTINQPPQTIAAGSFMDKKKEMERNEIINALQACGGKQKDAAKLLGISESTLTRRVNSFKLEIYTQKGK